MQIKDDFLNELRIASPCPVAWQDMIGTDQVRLCHQCDLHVYDISELTRDEAIALIASSEGRICARLHRRADGTVITRDCPVGLRALRKRVARRAGAALTAILSLSVTVFAQTRTQDKEPGKKQVLVTFERKQSQDMKVIVTGTVTDLNGGSIAGATITLIDEATDDKVSTSTNDAGEFRFAALKDGKYILRIESPNFKKLAVSDLVLKTGEVLLLSAMLEVNLNTINMGIVELPPEPIPIYQNGTLRLSGDLIRKWPH